MSEENAVENEEVDTDVVEEVAEAAPKAPVVAKIIRGRMPLPLVWHCRFVASAVGEDTMDEEGEIIPGGYASDSAVAKDLMTTAGKIMDIRTNRNFKYLTEKTTFSQADIDEAKDQLRKNIAEGKKRGADEPSHDFTEDQAAPLFKILDNMVSEASTVREDRDAFNEANPRKGKETAAPVAETEAATEEAEANDLAQTDADADAELEEELEEDAELDDILS